MARFHFHLWDGNALISDLEGVELADVQEVMPRSIVIARELLAEEIRQGQLPLCMRLDIEDAEKRLVHQLHFKDVVEILN
jgi:hypothetical protein